MRFTRGLIWHYVFVLWVQGIFSDDTDETRIVNITQGLVRGHLEPDGGVYAFYNIPYASVPTGTDRFKAPLPPPVWMHTFDAVDRGIVCPQPGGFLTMQEDCLVANIFVPDTLANNIPVLVYVHGGAYQYGTGNTVRLNTLVRTNKLIVVAFNYRLGVHGFLCLGTEGAPGNAGLKDQVALLRWVQDNIASFGGNPDDVTLLGCSAGSGSIDFLTISSITTGLFKKAVMDSGVAFGGVGPQIEPLVNAQNYAKLLNFDNVDDLDALEEFYKTAPFELLYSEQEAIAVNKNGMLLFTPCVERDIGQERVLEDAPLNIIKQGNYNKIPLLYGFNTMEGLLKISNFETWKDKMNEEFAEFLPIELYFENEEDRQNVANRVKTFYFGDKGVTEETILGYLDYYTDILFSYSMMKLLSSRLESLSDTIYLYEYTFVDENTPEIPYTNVTGSDHCDQTKAIIDMNKTGATEEYIRMKAIMREYWLNFIWTGSPWKEDSELVFWPPANLDDSPYMYLGRTIQVKHKLLAERVALWDSIYEDYYRAPMPPSGAAASLTISKLTIFGVYFVVVMYFYSS